MFQSDDHIQLIDPEYNKEASYRYNLSIQLFHDGIEFCVLDNDRTKYIALESFTFPLIKDEEQLCAKYRELVLGHAFLFKKFKRVKISWAGSKSTLVPSPLFKENEVISYLDFADSLNDQGVVRFNKLFNLDAYCIFTLPFSIQTFIEEIFSESSLVHYAVPLIENLSVRYKRKEQEKKVFLNVKRSHFEMIFFEGKKLFFYNSFYFANTEEFMYYVLFVYEQLNLNPEEHPLKLLGEIALESDLHNMLLKYIRNVDFINRDDTYTYSSVLRDLPAHYFYDLFILNLCE